MKKLLLIGSFVLGLTVMASAFNFGFETKNLKSEGIFVGASMVRNYADPLGGFQPNNINLSLGMTWDIYGIKTDIVPLQINFGTESNLKFGIFLRKYLVK